MEKVAKIQNMFGKRRYRGPNPKLIAKCLAVFAVVFAVALAIPPMRACLFEWKADLDKLVGNRAAEIEDLTVALNAVPGDLHILERRAQALEDSRETAKAIDDYQQLQLTALVHLSQLYTKAAKFDQAEECCHQWLRIAPDSGVAYHAKARLLEAEHKYDESTEAYEKSISLGGGLAARLDRDNLMQKMQFRNMDPLVEPPLENKDNDYDSLVHDAIALGQTNLGASYAKLDKAIKLDSNRPDAYDIRGILYVSHGQYRLGIQDLQMGEELRSKQPPASNPKGAVLMSAAGLYRAGEVSMWAGIAYNKIGDHINALKEFDKAVSLSPSPKMLRLRAGTYSLLGAKEKARADLKSALTAVDNYDPGDMYSAVTAH
jgi:tetratricopeptide (TPR) repeat protein